MKQDKTTSQKTTGIKFINTKSCLVLISILIWLITVALTVLASFLYKKEIGELIKITSFCVIGATVFICSFLLSQFSRCLDYDNNDHPYRFYLIYIIALVISLVFPLMNEAGWAFMGIAVAFSVYSSPSVGLAGTITLITDCCLLSSNNNENAFVVYFTASVLAVVLFQKLDKNFKIGAYLFVSLFSLLVIETAGFIFLENKEFNFEQFIMPIVNIAVNALIIFGTFKYFNEFVANKYTNKYLELNDQEYKVLQHIKASNKDEYFRSIHTAYLVERMANAIGCDVLIAKNLAYYHRIKKIYDYNDSQCENFTIENEFPPEAKEKLLEYFKNVNPTNKESSLVFLSDHLINTLQKIFSKDNQIKIDYNELIDTLFEKEFIDKALDECDLTRKDIRIVKEIMKKETLYYDFLR